MGIEDGGLEIVGLMRNLPGFEADFPEYEERLKVYGAASPACLCKYIVKESCVENKASKMAQRKPRSGRLWKKTV